MLDVIGQTQFPSPPQVNNRQLLNDIGREYAKIHKQIPIVENVCYLGQERRSFLIPFKRRNKTLNVFVSPHGKSYITIFFVS